MNVLAVIPARGGSTRIPGKNLTSFGAETLLARTIRHAFSAKSVTDVVVSTDDAAIGREAEAMGALVIDRPVEIASTEASTELAISHVLANIDGLIGWPEIIVLLQCTSPFRSRSDIDKTVDLACRDEVDSVVSVIEDYGLFWELDGLRPWGVQPVNYLPVNRKREQDRQPWLRENGSIYAFSSLGFEGAKVRIFGRVAYHLMHPVTALQIDTPSDLVTARALLPVVDSILDDSDLASVQHCDLPATEPVKSNETRSV